MIVAGLASCTSHGLAPTPSVPEDASTADASVPADFKSDLRPAARCPRRKLQPGWIFGGACADRPVKSSGAKLGLPKYYGYAVTLHIPRNDAKRGVKLRIVDAIGSADIRPYKGKVFPSYAKAFLYFKIVNSGKAIRFSKGGTVSFEIATTSPVLGECSIARLTEKKKEFTWRTLPVKGVIDGKNLIFDVMVKTDDDVPSGEQYFTFSCETTPTPTPSPSPTPTGVGNTNCTAPAVTAGVYTNIYTSGVASGDTYVEQSGDWEAINYSGYLATPTPGPSSKPTPTPKPSPTPVPTPTPTPVMYTEYIGEYTVTSYTGNSAYGGTYTTLPTTGCFFMILEQPVGGTIGQIRFRHIVTAHAAPTPNAEGNGLPNEPGTLNEYIDEYGSLTSLTINSLTTTSGSGTLSFTNSADSTVTGNITITGSQTGITSPDLRSPSRAFWFHRLR